MRINPVESPLFVAWLAIWLFIANVPTEASWPVYSHALRLISWTMVWSPLLLVNGVHLSQKSTIIAIGICLYVLVLNLDPFGFPAAHLVANIATAVVVVSGYATSKYTGQFVKAIDLVLYLWSAMLLVQLSAYLSTGHIVDFHSLLFPFSEARYFEVMSNFYRFTGPHIEPGTYCAWTYGLMLLRIFFGRRILTGSTILASATLPLTLSVWGVFAGLVFVLATVIVAATKRQRHLSVATLICLFGLLLYFYGNRGDDIYEYLQGRAALTDVSGRAKEWAYEDFLANFRQYVLLGKNFVYSYCSGCLSAQDAGLGLNLTVYMGLPFTLLAVCMILRSAYVNIGWALVLMAVPLFFSKFYVWEEIFWIVFILAFNFKKNREEGSHYKSRHESRVKAGLP